MPPSREEGFALPESINQDRPEGDSGFAFTCVRCLRDLVEFIEVEAAAGPTNGHMQPNLCADCCADTHVEQVGLIGYWVGFEGYPDHGCWVFGYDERQLRLDDHPPL